MRTETRTADTPWQVIDVMTEVCLGWYSSDFEGRNANKGKPIDTFYRPTRRKAKK